ncbi:MAG: helix-turn-helix transcriptional regulator [Bacilli bacterium]|jgi:transcriptional regulator with XRE-family HTH domain|nr:helix-turn-helix transcriptional regulator [Bacilli bacterium]MCX4254348.1 helix-turn-helix transcriptional regulator [Bacilli bacterium]
MQDKKSFGKYIAEKRKEAKLTQEELANMLYVIPTTISKWERGISYPDITVISKLCSILKISEHEFFMACDDEALNEEKREIKKYRTIKKWLINSLNISYIIGIVVCFICNLIIDKTISWFLIVLVSIAISFTITTLPFLFKKSKCKLIKVSLVFTMLTYLLLLTINYVNKGDWLIDSLIIASFCFSILWVDILIISFVKINKYYKISISLILLGLSTIISNPFCNNILNIPNEGSNLPNVISGIILIIIAFIFLIKGHQKND